MASNVGSGRHHHRQSAEHHHRQACRTYPYGSFAAALSPVAAGGPGVAVAGRWGCCRSAVNSWVGERACRRSARGCGIQPRAIGERGALIATAVMIVFFLGQPPAKVAIIVGGAVLLLSGGSSPSASMHEIDWALLLLFAGLFILVGGGSRRLMAPGVGRSRVLGPGPAGSARCRRGGAVKPCQQRAGGAGAAAAGWAAAARCGAAAGWCLAMASTFAGNLTIVGSVANLIVVRARAAQAASTIISGPISASARR